MSRPGRAVPAIHPGLDISLDIPERTGSHDLPLERAPYATRPGPPFPRRRPDAITTWEPPPLVEARNAVSEPIPQPERPFDRANSYDAPKWAHVNWPHRRKERGPDSARMRRHHLGNDPNATAAVAHPPAVLPSIMAEGDPLAAMRSIIDSSQATIRRDLDTIVDYEDALRDQESELETQDATIERQDAEIVRLLDRVDHLQRSRERIRTERDLFQTERELERAANHNLRTQLENIPDGNQVEEESGRLLQALRTARAARDQLGRDNEQLQGQVNGLQVERDQLQGQRDRYRLERDQGRAEVASLRARLQAAVNALPAGPVVAAPVVPAPVVPAPVGPPQRAPGRAQGRERGNGRGRGNANAAATRRSQPKRACKVVKSYKQ